MSSIRRRTRCAAAPGDVYQETKKLEGEVLARQTGVEQGIAVTIARPTGIYGPGDRRLLKMFRGVAPGDLILLGSGNIFYHLTYIDDLVEGVPAVWRRVRWCGANLHHLPAPR